MLMKNLSMRLQWQSNGADRSGAEKKNREKNKTLTRYIGQLSLSMTTAFEHFKGNICCYG